jgi:hypothetical protein
MRTDDDTTQLQLIRVSPQNKTLVDEIIQLGDRNRRTLGFMPTGAFWQAASSGTLMAAISEGRLVGYALYWLFEVNRDAAVAR